MAANSYTTANLLTSIRRNGHIPTASAPFQDSDLLAMADEECQTSLLRQILSVRENFYLTSIDYTANATGTYAIPTRAIGGALADVKIYNGSSIYPVGRTEIDAQFSTITSSTGYYAFYIQGNNIVVLPNPTSGTVRLWYYVRPSTLIATSAASQVTVIASNVLTFASLPSTITTSTPCDLVKDQPFFDIQGMDLTPTVVTSTQLTFSAVPSALVVGDWVALAGQTPVPQIPVEFRPLLSQRVVVKYYEAQGYLGKKKAAQEKYTEMEKDLMGIINPRVVEAVKTIVPDGSLIGGYRRWRAWRAT